MVVGAVPLDRHARPVTGSSWHAPVSLAGIEAAAMCAAVCIPLSHPSPQLRIQRACGGESSHPLFGASFIDLLVVVQLVVGTAPRRVKW